MLYYDVAYLCLNYYLFLIFLSFPDFSEFEESDDELLNEDFQPCLIEKRHVEEGVLFELESEHQLNVKVRIWS